MAGETENIRESSSVITWSTEYNLDSFLEISPHSLVQAVSPVVHLNKARCSKSVFEIHLEQCMPAGSHGEKTYSLDR